MFCVKCGKKAEEGARFCADCGAPLETVPAPVTPEPEVVPAVPVAEFEEQSPVTGAPEKEEPVATPVEPVATPAEPVATPAEPVVTPAEPVATPAEPVATPAEPVATPAEPVATPAEPVATPVTPVVPPQAGFTPPPAPPAGNLSPTVSTATFFWLDLVMAIPLAGLIVCIVLACGVTSKKSLENWAKAKLIWTLIEFILLLVLVILVIVGFARNSAAMAELWRLLQ